MPISNFQFPGVELTQEYAAATTAITSEQQVLCVGVRYKSDTFKPTNSESWIPQTGLAAQDVTGIAAGYTLDNTTDGQAHQSLTITNGLFMYASDNTDTATVDATAKTITFDFAVAFGNGVNADVRFGQRGIRVGDPIIIGKSGVDEPIITTVVAITSSVTGGALDTVALASGDLTGTITIIMFAVVATVEVQNTGSATYYTLSTSGSTPTLEISGTIQTTLDGFGETPMSALLVFMRAVSTDKVPSFTLNFREVYNTGTPLLDSVSSYADVVTKLGEPGLDNPLALCCACALSECGGIPVWFVTATADTAAAYALALGLADRRSNIYSIVPCTSDKALIKKCIELSNTVSSDKEGRTRRTVWYGIDADTTIPTDMPESVAAVKDDLIAQRKAVGAYVRAQCVWANGATYGSLDVPSYAVAAAAAGKRAYEAPQRPLSYLGFNAITVKNSIPFSMQQLRDLGAEGIWIVALNANDETVTMRQVTSAVADDLKQDEESMVSNVDNVCINLMQVGQNYVGNTNITPILLARINADITSILEYFTTNRTNSVYIGPQLLDYEIISLYQDPANQDHVIAVIAITPPRPFNRLIMTVTIL